jgi:hypothetical protein
MEDSLSSVSDDVSGSWETHRNEFIFISLSGTHRLQHPYEINIVRRQLQQEQYEEVEEREGNDQQQFVQRDCQRSQR